MTAPTIHDVTLPSLDGGTIALADFAGTPLLIVNTASKCGFTPQYEGLQTLWETYRGRGLTVIGVPSDDFGHQEPGAEPEIAAFCQKNYGVSFPMTAKLHVSGRRAHALFRLLGEQGGVLSRPRWNFYKYLVAPDGTLATWFSSLTGPTSARIEKAIERYV